MATMLDALSGISKRRNTVEAVLESVYELLHSIESDPGRVKEFAEALRVSTPNLAKSTLPVPEPVAEKKPEPETKKETAHVDPAHDPASGDPPTHRRRG